MPSPPNDCFWLRSRPETSIKLPKRPSTTTGARFLRKASPHSTLFTGPQLQMRLSSSLFLVAALATLQAFSAPVADGEVASVAHVMAPGVDLSKQIILPSFQDGTGAEVQVIADGSSLQKRQYFCFGSCASVWGF
ncbi:hypothetical protein OBBRIDRAFT_225377 [Obba rivulosa]|uniref:Uncharacterized protein n=1 Tax=Obba rivulosa TaxID=1052685 RepID=A0A8E2AKV5_9APHY|nr:hypothetical protein OBBRIDRAFT_225377 [Obba rivulosa]